MRSFRLSEITPGSASFPLNNWYIAAYSEEITQRPFARTILGMPMVFYRTAAGEPAVLFDRCPHRGMPLSQGSVCGDSLQCAYHGIEFSTAGSCVKIPSGGVISPEMYVRSFPAIEVWQWLWVWPGDPALADPALIPDHSAFGIDEPGWHAKPGPLLPVNANYLLPFENLLDASHITFLHDGKIDSGEVALKQPHLEQRDNRIRVIRDMPNEKQSELTVHVFNLTGDYANRTIIAEAQPPNLCGIRVEISPVDDEGSSTQINQLIVGITPQRESTTLEFTAVAQTFPFAYEGWYESLRELLLEDVEAMEAIQALFNRLEPAQRKEVSVRADAGAMRARDAIGHMLAAEQSSADGVDYATK